MKLYAIPVIAALCILLAGCNPADLADNNVTQQAREYFPQAEISHPKPYILQVNTHVDNISEKFAAKVMGQLITEHKGELQLLPILGFSVINIAFDNGGCGWTTTNEYFGCRSFARPDQYDFYDFDGTLFSSRPRDGRAER